jgi:hypothetical protein
MNKLLEELRAQRALIQKHLAWLDEQIAKLEPTSPNEAEQTEATVDTQEQAPEKMQNPLESKPAASVLAGSDSKTEGEPSPSLADDDANRSQQLLQDYKPASGNDIMRAKIGCFALFILGTGLFLFLLFGLPYLLD